LIKPGRQVVGTFSRSLDRCFPQKTQRAINNQLKMPRLTQLKMPRLTPATMTP
jgi:hypothetical protein